MNNRPNNRPLVQESRAKVRRAYPDAANLSDMPHVGQGRNRFHNPKVNRDVALGLALVLFPWIVCLLLVYVGPYVWNGVAELISWATQ